MADPPVNVTVNVTVDDPEPSEFRLLVVLLIGLLLTGAVIMLRPWFGQALSWLRSQDLLVPADQAALQLPGDVGLTWMSLGIGFAAAVLLLWLGSKLLSLLGLTKG